jgi:3-oxoacyl-[acyl-carrier-protein] synthase II
MMMMTSRRVVVTGMGAISPLGNTLEASWKSLLENKCGMTSLATALELQGLLTDVYQRELQLSQTLPCQVAAPVRGLEYDNRTSRFVQLALLAGREAIEQAQLTYWLANNEHHQECVGVSIGNGMSGVREIVEAAKTVQELGVRRLSPHFVPKVLANSAAGRLSLEYKLKGPNLSSSTACAAASHAIGDAMRCIQYNSADIMLAGGTEACIDPLSIAGFCRLRALSTNFPPNEASRPFDKDRDGFVMGEGSAILVLEELEHAKKRGVSILAELRGYGLTGDAHHVTAPEPTGRGAERAMRMALQQAGLPAASVQYVNAHATSTRLGDEIEALAIDRTLCRADRIDDLFVSSTKGATGHLLGAAGAIEAAFTIRSLMDGTIPPTKNLTELDENESSTSFHYVQHAPVNACANFDVAMSNSFGFGGTNASLVFTKYKND